ncbi:MAG TPA: alpha-mannosidase [Methylomirabilota bacterium]|nr:alpha-mannosidase [Methylomirabilota bacterium]
MTAVETAPTPTVVHLVPHTHWDREWYEPFQTFRLRLVDLVDELLERMEADSRLRFTLDGQCATVDDYLEVRPEAEPLIRRLVAEGRLAIGPWQILMDEFLVSGETMVRNLELGWNRATELGGAMRVGYLPDMFGHIAQMPQMLRRAGIERAVVWRGVPAVIDRNVFVWASPDGSEVETEYLVGGYGNGAYLFDVPDRLRSKLAAHVDANESFYGRHSILAMYGTDHAVPSPRLADLVDAMNADASSVVVRMETLADYAARSDAEIPADGHPSWAGELRSGARANMLMNVTSARIDIKIACGHAERLLERYAEPLTALHGPAWPERQLELAWRRIVDNSAHDSICGCSHDAVGAQVLTRFAEAEQIGRGVLTRTLDAIAGRAPNGQWVAINPSPFPRDDLVEFDVAVPPEWESVELQSGGRRIPSQDGGRGDPVLADLKLRGSEIPELFRRRRHGRELFGRQINSVDIEPDHPDGTPLIRVIADDIADPPELDVEELLDRVHRAVLARPDDAWRLVVRSNERCHIVAQVSMPALGWSTIEVVEGHGGIGDEPVANAVVATERGLANGLVSVEVDDVGTFRLSGGGVDLEGVGRIVDGGELGDSYNYGPPTPDVLVERPTEVEVQAGPRGPLRSVLTVRRRFDWPVAFEPRGGVRTATTVPTDVFTTLELRAGEPFVRVEVRFENRSRDHRVRFHVPLAGAATASAAEGQYAVVERGLEVEGGHGEVPLATFPARGFVNANGVSVLLDHIVEYEVVGARELALTLLRSFGWISRNANPYREDPAGPEIAVPAAQLLGDRSMRFALMPHAGTWATADVLAMAERYQHGPLAVRGRGSVAGRRAGRDNGAGGSGLTVDGAGVVLTALRRRGEWLELRVVAETADPTEAVVEGPFDAARDADLLGRPLGSLATDGGTLRIALGPWEIRTVQLRSAQATPGL